MTAPSEYAFNFWKKHRDRLLIYLETLPPNMPTLKSIRIGHRSYQVDDVVEYCKLVGARLDRFTHDDADWLWVKATNTLFEAELPFGKGKGLSYDRR